MYSRLTEVLRFTPSKAGIAVAARPRKAASSRRRCRSSQTAGVCGTLSMCASARRRPSQRMLRIIRRAWFCVTQCEFCSDSSSVMAKPLANSNALSYIARRIAGSPSRPSVGRPCGAR